MIDQKLIVPGLLTCLGLAVLASFEQRSSTLSHLFIRLRQKYVQPSDRVLGERPIDRVPEGESALKILSEDERESLRLGEGEEIPYLDEYPPSRRHVLAELASEGKAPSLGPADKIPDIPTGEDTTPTGFTAEEIEKLGRFPDYAALSGVPLPEARTDFDIKTAMPRPYRPLRYPYHQTMALHKLDSDFWLELENSYFDRMKERQALFAEHGSTILRQLPGAEREVRELMEMVVQFICARYPMHFSLVEDYTVLKNNLLGTRTYLETVHPLHVLLNNVPEDFAVMVRHPKTGYYHMRAGVLCSVLGWTLSTKIGKRLHEIHAPVPYYKERMKFSMDRYFSKMPTDRPIQRGSWGLEEGDMLWLPPGDAHEPDREVQNPNMSLDDIRFRVDWQTLRRLPLTGCIIFNFKAVFTPVEQFRNEPYIPRLLLKTLYDRNDRIMEYKKSWHTEHVVIPAMEQYEREQIEAGKMPADWKPKTLEESPFYPGWEDIWHGRQGF